MNLLNILIGRRLANAEAQGRKITTLEGFAAMGLDGLSSSAYGPEAALIILMAAGSAGLGEIRPVMLAVLLLLLMLFVSYWQTIEAYPSNAGSYTVARENLGANAGLLAATALMIDYVLNVAVGISAGVGALTSAVPQLHPYTLPLCLGILALITIVNLRGTMEAGIVFSVPTYLFVASFGGLLLFGVIEDPRCSGKSGPGRAAAAAPPGSRGSDIMAAAARFCQRLHGNDRGRGGQQRSERVPRPNHEICPPHPGRHRIDPGRVARRYRLSRARLPGRSRWTNRSPATRACCRRSRRRSSGVAPSISSRSEACSPSSAFPPIRALSPSRNSAGSWRKMRICRAPSPCPGAGCVYSVGILWLTLTAGAAADCVWRHHRPADPAIRRRRLSRLHALAARDGGALASAARAAACGSRSMARARWRPGAALAVILAAKFVEGAWITVIAIPLVLALLKAIKRYYDLIDQPASRRRTGQSAWICSRRSR